MHETNLMRPKDAARRLGVWVGTLRRWAEAGKLTEIRTLGQHRRYLADEIEAILNRPTGQEAR